MGRAGLRPHPLASSVPVLTPCPPLRSGEGEPWTDAVLLDSPPPCRIVRSNAEPEGIQHVIPDGSQTCLILGPASPLSPPLRSVLTPLSPSPFRRGGTTEHGSERPAEPGRRDSGDGSAQQVGPVAPAESDVRATLENDDRVAVEPRLDLAHAVEVHERRPADAAKPRFVEPRLERRERGADRVGPV